MSCCFPFRVCCPPEEHEAALADQLAEWCELWGGLPADIAKMLAGKLLATADLAPPGTAQAVIDGWGAGAKLRSAAIGDRLVGLYAKSFAEKADKGIA